ncbi:MAG: hypothetical protein FJW96_07030 [Actinobacteria bacterium]|nr:hypothetical protein [Actinomycetota bacterium]
MRMPRPARTELSLTEWAVLGVVAEREAHGWGVARELSSESDLGRIWSVSRPLVYRALAALRSHGYVADLAPAPSRAGPDRTPVAITGSGRSALRRWLARPVGHVRDLRTELLLKLRLLERSRKEVAPLLERQLRALERSERLLAKTAGGTDGGEPTALWRLANARSARAFVEALIERRAAEPVTYYAIGTVRSPHASLEGMPLQPLADDHGPTRIVLSEPHRGCLVDLDGFSHVWVVSHLHESAGWEETVEPFLDDRRRGTLATRSPHRPNPIGLSLCALLSVDPDGITVAGSDLLDGTPVLDLKPYVPLFDRPRGPVRAGWFEQRAGRVFERASDGRFAPRSRR